MLSDRQFQNTEKVFFGVDIFSLAPLSTYLYKVRSYPFLFSSSYEIMAYMAVLSSIGYFIYWEWLIDITMWHCMCIRQSYSQLSCSGLGIHIDVCGCFFFNCLNRPLPMPESSSSSPGRAGNLLGGPPRGGRAPAPPRGGNAPAGPPRTW